MELNFGSILWNLVNLLFVEKIRIIQPLRCVVKSNLDTFYLIFSLSEK